VKGRMNRWEGSRVKGRMNRWEGSREKGRMNRWEDPEREGRRVGERIKGERGMKGGSIQGKMGEQVHCWTVYTINTLRFQMSVCVIEVESWGWDYSSDGCVTFVLDILCIVCMITSRRT